MEDLHFVSTLDTDPFVNSANSLVHAVNNIATYVERTGGNIDNMFKALSKDGNFQGFEALEKQGHALSNVFTRLIEQYGLTGDAAQKAKDKINAAMKEIAESTDDPNVKLRKMADAFSIILTDIKQQNATGGGNGMQASLEDMRISALTLVGGFKDVNEEADALNNKLKELNERSFMQKVRDGIAAIKEGRNPLDDVFNTIKDYKAALETSSNMAGQAFMAQQAYVKALQDEIARLKNMIADPANADNVDSLTQEYDKQVQKLGEANAILEQINNLRSEIGQRQAHIQEYENDDRLKNQEKATRGLVDATKEYLDSVEDAKEETGKLSHSFDEANAAFERYAGKTEASSNEILSSLKKIAAYAGVAFGLNEIKNFIGQVAQTREYFQDIESSMNVFLGSAEKSAEFTQKLKDYAWYNMFEFSDLAKASQQMIAYGQDVDTIIPKLDMLSNIAAGTHAPLLEMVDAYNRAKSTGVVDANGIKSWATKGVVIRDVLKEMGDTAGTTQISFEQLNKVLEHLTGEGGMFHNLMAEQLNNISAEKGQLEDNLSNMFNEIGEKHQDAIIKWYKFQSELVDSYDELGGTEIDFVFNVAETGLNELMENWKMLVDIIKTSIAAYGSWRVALALVLPVKKAVTWWTNAESTALAVNTGKVKMETIAQGEATAAKVRHIQVQKMLNASMLASPYTWVAVALTGIATALISYYANAWNAEKAQNYLNKAIENYGDSLTDEEDSLKSNIDILKDTTATLHEQYKAYKELTKARAIFSQYTPEELKAMSPEQIEQLFSQDNAQKTQDYIENTKKMWDEFRQWIKSSGNGDLAIFGTGEKEKLKELAETYKLNVEDVLKAWDDHGAWDWNSKFSDLQVEAARSKLQEILEEKAYSGIVGGLKKGLTDNAILEQANTLIENFKKEMSSSNAKEFSDDAEKIAEKYASQLEPTIKNLREEATSLNKQITVATGDNKGKLELQLETVNTSIEFLEGLVSMFRSGVNNNEVVVKIEQEREKADLGGDFIKDFGAEYAQADQYVNKYAESLEKAIEAAHRMDGATEEDLASILENFGLTADGIEGDVGALRSKVSDEITALKKKLDEDLPKEEKRKIQLQIDKKEELLSYIDDVRTRLLGIVRNPYTLTLNVAGNALGFLNTLIGRGQNFIGKFTDALFKGSRSQKAQQDAKEQEHADALKNKNAGVGEYRTYETISQEKKNLENELKGLTPEQAKNSPLKQQIQALDEELKAYSTKDNQARKTAEQNATRRQKLFDLEQKKREEQAKQEADAYDAQQKARIAQIKDAGERQRAEEDEQHRLNMQAIDNRVEEMKRKRLEEARKEWEANNKDKTKVWADTDEAKAGIDGIKTRNDLLEEQKKILGDTNKEASKLTGSTKVIDEDAAQKSNGILEKIIGKLREIFLFTKDGKRVVVTEDVEVNVPEEETIEVSTTLGSVELPDIPETATVEVTAQIESGQYDELIEKFGEEVVKPVRIETDGEIVEGADETITVTVNTDASQLEELKAFLSQDASVKYTVGVEGEEDVVRLGEEAAVSARELKTIGFDDAFITALREGRVSSEEFASVIELLKNKQVELTNAQKDYESSLHLTNEQESISAAEKAVAEANRARQLEERQRAERQQLYDYIKEYGSIQQQREAITKEYDEKIARESNAIQKATLEKQKAHLLQELNMKEFQNSINWEVVFNDLDRLSTRALQDLRDKLRNALNSGDVSPENAQVLSEKILEAENELSSRKNVYASMIPALQDRLRITNQIKRAEDEIKVAQGDSVKKRQRIVDLLLQQSSMSEGAFNQQFSAELADDNFDGILSSLGIALDETTEEGKKMAIAMSDYRKSLESTTALQKNKETLKSLFKGDMNIGNAISDIFKNAANGGDTMGIINLVNDNIQSLPALIDTIGLSNTEFGKAVGEFAEGTNSFVSAIQSFASGDVIGGVTGIIKGFQSYGSMLGIGGGNAEKVNEAINRLSDRNEILITSIDRLNDTMSKQGGSKAIETYAKMAEMQKELEENLQEQMRLQMTYHSAHGSFNHYWGGFTDQQLADFNRLNDTDWNGDLSNLTADMAAMLMANADMWQAIEDTGKGGYGERVAEKIKALAEQAGVAKEQVAALNAQLTAGTTADSVFDDFLSSLYDLASGSEDVMDDIAKSWQQMVNKMVVNNLVGEDFRKELEGWYDELANLNKRRQGYNEDGSLIYGLDASGNAIAGMSDEQYKAELERLKADYDGYVNDAQGKIEEFTQLGIIQPIEDAADASLITLDEIRSGWMNILMDMSSDTESWSQDIAKMMTEALIQSQIFDEGWEEQQSDWIDRYNQALKDQSLSDAQRKALLKGLQEEQEAWVDDSRRKVKAIMEMTGYDTATTAEQQNASVQAMERITVDQADELIGRMNAGQMIWEQGNDLSRQIAASIASINDLVSNGVVRGVNDLVGLAITRNQHLSGILEACQGIHSDMNLGLEDLRRDIQKL